MEVVLVKKLVFGVLLITVVVALAFAGYYLRERSRFRETMRPLVVEDSADFQSTQSDFSMQARDRRIVQVKLYDTGFFRGGRDRIVQLMEAENDYLLWTNV
jgi:hypothetical protein